MTWRLIPAADFHQLADRWDALQSETTSLPFLESPVIQLLLDVFGEGSEQLALHEVDGRLDAATIVVNKGRGRWETFQPSQLPVGPWVARPGPTLDVRVASLLQALPGLPLTLGVTQLDPRLVPRTDDSETFRAQDYVPTSYVRIEGEFDAYWGARGKNLRQNVRKQFNKLQSLDLGTRLEVLTRPEDIDAAIALYGELESAGWKAEKGTAVHAANAQGRFYSELLKHFCSVGRGQVVRFSIGERVAAMDLCIDNGKVVVILKTTYDESVRQYSPSALMRYEEFLRWWTEAKFERIEFYGKTMEWHTRWTADETQLFHATAYRNRWIRTAHEGLVALRTPESESVDGGSA